jgi:hypothetical protein
MKKTVLATVLGLSLSAAWAVDWDADDDFVMFSDDGKIVGQGELDDDGLDLEILSGYTGFIRFDAGGEMVEGMISADGSITLINAGGLVDLGDDLSNKGYSLVVTPVEGIAAPAGIVVTPTDPARDDDDKDDNDDNSSGTGNDDDTDDNSSDDGRNDGTSGGDDTDDNSGSSNSTSTDDNDNDSNDDSHDTDSDDSDDD